MKKRFVVLALVGVLTLLLSACAPRPGGGQTAAMAEEGDLVVDLPALVLDVAQDGSASIGGFDVMDLIGVPVSFPADAVAELAGLNIQHISVETLPSGLTLRVNGLPFLGSMSYGGDSLHGLVHVLEDLGESSAMAALGGMAPIVGGLAPVLDNLGIGVVVKFPVAAGAEEFPLVMELSDDDGSDIGGFLDAVEQQPRISVPIMIAPDGSWSVGELEQGLVEGLVGQEGSLGLPPATVEMMSDSGISDLQISTAEDGLEISINGHGLPVFTWNNGEIESLMALQENAPAMAGIGDLLDLVSTLIPLLQVTDVTISLMFP